MSLNEIHVGGYVEAVERFIPSKNGQNKVLCAHGLMRRSNGFSIKTVIISSAFTQAGKSIKDSDVKIYLFDLFMS